MRVNRHPGKGCDYGALRHKQKNVIARRITERLKIALSLGKDQVSLGETQLELLTAIVKQRARSIRAVVYLAFEVFDIFFKAYRLHMSFGIAGSGVESLFPGY